MHLYMVFQATFSQDHTERGLLTLSSSMFMFQLKYIANALQNVSFSSFTLLPIVRMSVISITTQKCHFQFFAHSPYSGSNINIEYLIAKVAMATTMHKIWIMKVLGVQRDIVRDSNNISATVCIKLASCP